MKDLKSWPVVRFKGREYLWIGDKFARDEEAAIATKRQYEKGLCSFAHYFPGRGVLRFNKVIGTFSDLKPLKKRVRAGPTALGFANAIEAMLDPRVWWGVM